MASDCDFVRARLHCLPGDGPRFTHTSPVRSISMRFWSCVFACPFSHSQSYLGLDLTDKKHIKRACNDDYVCICWRKRSRGDTCVHKFGYQAPDRTTLHIQMCLDWPWQVTKRQTSSDSVHFHAPASYYLTAPLTLHALYFPFIHFYNPSFPREQAHHQSWRFSQGKRLHAYQTYRRFILQLFICRFCFSSHVTEVIYAVLFHPSRASAILKYKHLREHTYYIIPRGCV